MDQVEMKAREFKSWSAVAPGWRKHDESLRRNTRNVVARMLDLAGLQQGSHVLDIACGTGEPAIPAAERVGPTGHVIAMDYVPEMIAFAREKAAALGLNNIEFRIDDGEVLQFAPDSVDAVTIRWGLMFMPDPVACLKRAHAALKPGGRIVVANWAGPERNPWATVAVGVMKRHMEIPQPPPGATGLYSFADPARSRDVLEQAGFQSISIEELAVPVIDTTSGEEYFTWVKEMAGPIAALYAKLSPDLQARVDREAAVEAKRQSSVPEAVSLMGVTWIASAFK